MSTFHLHITGRVQGVGFRPTVYNLAKHFHLEGAVSNGNDGVHIYFECDSIEEAQLFEREIVKNKPSRSIIERTALKSTDPRAFDGFSILESDDQCHVDGLKIAPDFALCESCRKELADHSDRRYQYPFITCTQCGPRYSVQSSTPYDRDMTTMSAFRMCAACKAEYNDVDDRRFFSQTNSCKDCGIKLKLRIASSDIETNGELALQKAIESLKGGQIVAIKGIGGYLLLCDASSDDVVAALRNRKSRPHKPFAVMYPNIATIHRDCHLEERRIEVLNSPEAPILLLNRKNDSNAIAFGAISPGLDTLGVMLPYAPLLQLIAQEFDEALVATSANISGSPILYLDEEAECLLNGIADMVLMHDREITIPQDDSVVAYTGERHILIRRSRGYAPSYFGALPDYSEEGWLALGAHMKGSVALACGNLWHVSQYFGSLDSFESQTAYKHTLTHLTQLVDFRTRGILTDSHPGYFVNQLGQEYSDALDVPLIQIQHHEAHFAAVLQENDLLKTDHRIMGVIWDGTGYGTDGHIWGGEFFTYQNDEIERINHLGYVPHLASDKMSREPRIAALAYLSEIPGLEELLRDKFSEEEWRVYKSLIRSNTIKSSSVGRLFDAVACLIGLIDQSTYEGQAAMLLEQSARWCNESDQVGYKINYSNSKIDTCTLFIEMLKDLNEQCPPSIIAFKFHLALVDLIRAVALHYDLQHLAFSGGVFQNALLVQLIDQRLGHEFELYFHKQLSPNDENISFGQLAHYHIQLRSLNNLKIEDNYVFSNSR